MFVKEFNICCCLLKLKICTQTFQTICRHQQLFAEISLSGCFRIEAIYHGAADTKDTLRKKLYFLNSVLSKYFHAFFFNNRNYSPEVTNIQRREEELNITVLRVNNFGIKQKMAWNIYFIIYPKHQTKSGSMLRRHRIFQ